VYSYNCSDHKQHPANTDRGGANTFGPKLKEDLEQIDGMPGIHNFHIWNLSADKPLLKVHIDVQNGDCQTHNVSAIHLY